MDGWRPYSSIHPNIVEVIPENIRYRRIVVFDLDGGCWLKDFKAMLSIEKFIYLFNLPEATHGVQLDRYGNDKWKGNLESSGRFSSKLASTNAIWKPWPPLI